MQFQFFYFLNYIQLIVFLFRLFCIKFYLLLKILVNDTQREGTKISKKKEVALVLSTGSLGYGLLEILWRKHTHWSMLITGGVCFYSIYQINKKIKTGLMRRCLVFSAVITGWELVAGCLFNKLMHLSVWDYKAHRGNILGQICPLYSFLWFLLSFPLVFICNLIQKSTK